MGSLLLLLCVGRAEYSNRGILVKSQGFVYAQLHTYILVYIHKIALISQPDKDQRKELDLDKMII